MAEDRSPSRDRNALLCAKPSAVYANRLQRYRDDIWLIWSNKWACWYRSDCSGYTTDITQAGLYDRETAAKHYPGDVPRRYRDVEPFPLSSVQHQLRIAGEVAQEGLDKAKQRLGLMASVANGSCTAVQAMSHG